MHKKVRNKNRRRIDYGRVSSIDPNSLISGYLRTSIKEWKAASLAESNNKCIITGDTENLVIHHISKRFKDIYMEAHNNLKIEFKGSLCRYTMEELIKLKEETNRLHFKYGLGIAIRNDLHKKYHKIYGNNINSETFHIFYKNNVIKDLKDSNK